MANPSQPSKHAVLQLRPSTRQTIVKTTTRTTIHYAPIELPKPPSPSLTGDYVLDKHSHPIKLAEEKAGPSSFAGESVRQFELAFGSDAEVTNGNGLKAVYSLNGHKLQDDDKQHPVAGVVDRKGKGRAKDAEDTSLLPPREHVKRKRLDSNAGGSLQLSLDSAEATTSILDSPPRKKSRPVNDQDDSGFLTPESFPTKEYDTQKRLEAASSRLEERLKARTSNAVSRNAPDVNLVLPSPNLSPRPVESGGVNNEALENGQSESSLEDEESGQVIRYNTAQKGKGRAGQSLQANVVVSQTEEVVEDDDGEDDQKRLACLGRGYTLSTLFSLPNLVSEFSSLAPKLQTHLLYQLLRQSSTPVLQSINHIIQPALRRDFISDLPPELSLQVLSYLDLPTIMRSLLVSKNWKRFIDSQGQIWADLMRDDDLWTGGPPDQSSQFAENQEAEFWNGIGTAKATSSTSMPTSAKNTNRKSRKNHVLHTAAQSAQTETRESGRELSMRHLLAVHDWKEELFLKRWKDGVWNEHFDADAAAIPTAEKLAAVAKEATSATNNAQARALFTTALPSTPGRLRRSSLRPRIEAETSSNYQPGVPKTPTSPLSTAQCLPNQPNCIHPYKLIFKKRRTVRSRWTNGDDDPATAMHRITFRGAQTSVITNLQFDNEKIVTASDDHFIDVYDTATGNMRTRLAGHEGGVWALHYVGNVLVSGSTDRTLRIWDLETGDCTHVFYGHTSTIRCLQIVMPVNVNPDPNGPPVWEPPYPLIVTGSRDWTLRVWRFPSPSRASSLMPLAPPSPSDDITDPANNAYHLRVLRGHGLAVRALAAHGRTVVSASYDTYLRVWDMLSGECRHKLVGHTAKVYSVALDPARQRCSSGSMDGTVRIWSMETGEPLFKLDGHSSLVGLLGCSYHFLVSAGADSTLKVWDPQSGVNIDTLAANAGAITCFKHDDFRVVSGCDGQIRCWDIRKGTVMKDIIENMQGVWQLQFSDRFCVAAVSRDGATDFEILDFFPELRNDTSKRIASDSEAEYYDVPAHGHGYTTSHENDGLVGDEGTYIDEAEIIARGPYYEHPPSQVAMYSTPRHAATYRPFQQGAHDHAQLPYHDPYDGSARRATRHHHHHHHHHNSRASGSHRSHRSTRASQQGGTGAPASTSALATVQEPDSLHNLFAYSAHQENVETAGQSDASQPVQSGSNGTQHTHASQQSECAIEGAKHDTPEVKEEEAEEDSVMYE